MTNDKRVQLAELLILRTQEGKIKWEPRESDTFVALLGKSWVELSWLPNGYDQEEMDIFVTVKSSEGVQVERFSDGDLFELTEEAWYPKLKLFYSNVRRSALGADEVLDDILSELK